MYICIVETFPKSKTFIDKHFVPFAAQNEVALKIIFSFFLPIQNRLEGNSERRGTKKLQQECKAPSTQPFHPLVLEECSCLACLALFCTVDIYFSREHLYTFQTLFYLHLNFHFFFSLMLLIKSLRVYSQLTRSVRLQKVRNKK